VGLRVEGASRTQPVAVRRLETGDLEVLFSPGLVEGIAAGDVIRLTDSRTGDFEIVSRGGNLSLKLFHPGAIGPVLDWVGPELERLAGRLDGKIDRAAVLTIPATTGFPAIEAVMKRAVAAHPGLTWFYGNVYDSEDRPLNWWRS